MKQLSNGKPSLVRFLCVCTLAAMLRGDACSSDPESTNSSNSVTNASNTNNAIDPSCPQAQDLYDHSLKVYKQMLEGYRFGSTWEITIRSTERQYATLKGAIPLGPDATFEGERTYSSTTKLTFDVPDKHPPPFTCDEIAAMPGMVGSEAEARTYISEMYMVKIWDLWGLEPIVVKGGGTHSYRVNESFETYLKIYEFCVYPNPCGDKQDTKSGCRVTNRTHELTAELALDWDLEQNKVFLDIQEDETTPSGARKTQTRTHSEYKLTEGTLTGDVCDAVVPVCDGPTSEEVSCEGLRNDGGFLGQGPVPFKNGTHSLYLHEDEDGEGSTEVTLRCVEGCDCIAELDCDDGKVCTRDTCEDGNCKNTPDDLIEPPQKPDDCISCENGEEKSIREEARKMCKDLRAKVLAECTVTDAWMLHWIEQFAGVEQQYNYCLEGTDLPDGTYSVCSGAADCADGAPVRVASGMEDKECQTREGKHLMFLCEAVCSACR